MYLTTAFHESPRPPFPSISHYHSSTPLVYPYYPRGVFLFTQIKKKLSDYLFIQAWQQDKIKFW